MMSAHWMSRSLIAWLAAALLAGCTGEPGQSSPTSDGNGSAEADAQTGAEETGTNAKTTPETPETPDAAEKEQAKPKSAGASGKSESDAITLEPLEPAEFDQVLDKYRGQVVLVDFWATWCRPCMKQFPHTVEMSRKYAEEGLAVISVSMDDPKKRESALEFLRKQNARFENRLCTTGVSQKAFEAFAIDAGLPHYQVYDRQGHLARELGNSDLDNPTTPEDVEQAVLDVLAQRSEAAGS